VHIPGRQEHGDVEGLMEASNYKGYLLESEAAKALGEVGDAQGTGIAHSGSEGRR